MELKNIFAQDGEGSVIPYAVGHLYLPGGTTYATGVKDKNGADLANPMTATVQGLFQFAAPDGDYDFRVVGVGREFTLRLRFLDSVAAAAAVAADVSEAEAARDAAAQSADLAVEVVGAISDGNVAVYQGAGPIYPLAIDNDAAVLLGYDSDNDTIVGKGLVNTANAAEVIAGELLEFGQSDFGGVAGIAPVLTDATGKVLLGYDIDRRRVIGDGLTNTPAPTPDLQVDSPPVARALNHILFYGQSLSVGANTGAVISTTQPYSNVTFQGGPRAWTGTTASYSPLKPLVEDAVNPAPDGGTNRAETPCSGAASFATTLAAIENGSATASHIILASTAGRGGSTIAELEKGQSWYADKLLPQITAAKAINADYACHAVVWMQGENDGLGSTSFATYLAKLNQLSADIDADIRAISGQTSPVYLLTYQAAAYSLSWGQVQLAQLAAAQSNPLIHLITPIYHLPKADALHFTSIGSRWFGAYAGRAYKRLVRDGVAPRWLNPLSATLKGAQVRIRFDVPVRPLVLDTLNLGASTNYGFRVVDSGGTVAISEVYIDGDEVILDLSAIPSGPAVVRYALDYLGVNVENLSGASGNLHDSAPETVTIGGTVRNLYNWAPHFELPIIAIGE